MFGAIVSLVLWELCEARPSFKQERWKSLVYHRSETGFWREWILVSFLAVHHLSIRFLHSNYFKISFSSARTISECCVLTAVAACSALQPGLTSAVGDISISSIAGRRIYSPGWYMGYGRRVEIRCKRMPALERTNDESGIMKAFYLVEVCPSGCGRESKGMCSQCSWCSRHRVKF